VARRNVTALELSRVVVVLSSVQRYLAGRSAAPARLVLLDPPYSFTEAELAEVLQGLVTGGWLDPQALVVVERSGRSPEPRWPAGLVRESVRRYGETALWLAAPARPE